MKQKSKLRLFLGGIKKKLVERNRTFTTERHTQSQIDIEERKIRRRLKGKRFNSTYFNNNEDLVNFLIKIKSKELYANDLARPVSGYMHESIIAEQTMKEVWEDTKKFKLSHFDSPDFQNIIQAIDMTKDLEGDYVEIGTFTGSSANLALRYMDNIFMNRKSYFLDTYSGFDFEEAKESFDTGFEGTHYLERDKIINGLNEMFSRYNQDYHIIINNICKDDLPNQIKEIVIANIDVDMYDSTKSALNKVKNKIVQGGIIIIEDYGHTPALAGANLSVREFIKENKQFRPIYMASGQMFLLNGFVKDKKTEGDKNGR